MNYDDVAMQFDCDGSALVGIVSLPEQPIAKGVLVLVGGPQYRAGSHRQFTLLARGLASEGIATMRFDYRGMGDSAGTPHDFESVADDLRCAIDAFMQRVPALREIVIWGLCDGASAALLHGSDDPRVSGMVLLNPWVRTTGSHARATLKHYYLARLKEGAFWRKALGGHLDLRATARSFGELLKASRGAANAAAAATIGMLPSPLPSAGQDRPAGNAADRSETASAATQATQAAPAATVAIAPLPQRMLESLLRFDGKVLLITSGRDLTAQEFLDLVADSAQWRRALAAARVSRQALPNADHTFSRGVWREQVAQMTADWVRSW